MNINSHCILCLLNKEETSIRACLDEYQKTEYLKGAMRIMPGADLADTMPWISDQTYQLQSLVLRSLPDYARIRTYFNIILLEMESALKNVTGQEVDPLSYVLRLFHYGNYINFGTMGHVDEDILRSLLKQVREEALDTGVYQRFLSQTADSSSALSL